MKYLVLLGILLGSVTLLTAQKETINWMSWEEAVEKNKVEPRKIYVDLYTGWCGWCKKMDALTFKDKHLAKYMNENVYAVKFDAERKDTIQFNGHSFAFQGGGRRGAHQLATAMVDGQLGYPSFVAFDQNFERIFISPGFKDTEAVFTEIEYLSEEIYKEQGFKAYIESQK